MRELFEAAAQAQITLCGGHTEISEAVQRPVVVAMMAGTVKRNALVEKKNMGQGDVVVLTKKVAIEGTAIMAREFEASLRAKGLNDLQIEAGRNYLAQISIAPEAHAAAQRHLATAMHDVTEGGVATALEELSAAGGHRIRVDMEKIPISDLTREMCTALGLNPLGLIGSGSLLICCRAQKCTELINAIQALDISATPIGRVLVAGTGITAYEYGRHAEWPRFAADEITKLFSPG
jgi:hydrogenase maturation factor